MERPGTSRTTRSRPDPDGAVRIMQGMLFSSVQMGRNSGILSGSSWTPPGSSRILAHLRDLPRSPGGLRTAPEPCRSRPRPLRTTSGGRWKCMESPGSRGFAGLLRIAWQLSGAAQELLRPCLDLPGIWCGSGQEKYGTSGGSGAIRSYPESVRSLSGVCPESVRSLSGAIRSYPESVRSLSGARPELSGARRIPCRTLQRRPD